MLLMLLSAPALFRGKCVLDELFKNWRNLADHHITLTERQQLILLLRCVGADSSLLVEATGCAERTLRAETLRVAELICFGAGFRQSSYYTAGAWLVAHLSSDCSCLTAARRILAHTA
jgi:hypothetical protein